LPFRFQKKGPRLQVKCSRRYWMRNVGWRRYGSAGKKLGKLDWSPQREQGPEKNLLLALRASIHRLLFMQQASGVFYCLRGRGRVEPQFAVANSAREADRWGLGKVLDERAADYAHAYDPIALPP